MMPARYEYGSSQTGWCRCSMRPPRAMDSGTISEKKSRDIFTEMVDSGRSGSDIIAKRGMKQIHGPDTIRDVIGEVSPGQPDNVAAGRAGRGQLFDFFVGQVMIRPRGRANPKLVNRIIKELLDG